MHSAHSITINHSSTPKIIIDYFTKKQDNRVYLFLKGTVSLISSDPQYKDDNDRFITVSLKAFSFIIIIIKIYSHTKI